MLRFFTLSWLALLLLTCSLYATDQAPRPPQAPRKPYCLCWHKGEDCTCGGTCPCPGHLAVPPKAYSLAVWEAKRTGKPLVVWIGLIGKEVPGTVTVSVDYLPGYLPRTCMISRDAEHVTAKLAGTVTVEQIKAFLHPPTFQVSPVSMPQMRFAQPQFFGGGGSRGGC